MKALQCWCCQQWGNVSNNCTRDRASVKCDKTHAPRKCLYVQKKNSKPYCVNSKDYGLPSSYREYSQSLKYLKLRENLHNTANERRDQVTAWVFNSVNNIDYVQQGISFADCFNGVPFPQPGRKVSPIVHEFLKIAKVLCEPEPHFLEESLERFAKEQCLGFLNDLKKSYGP